MAEAEEVPTEAKVEEEVEAVEVVPSREGAMVFLLTEGGVVYEFDLPLSEAMLDQLKIGKVRQVADINGTPIQFVPTQVVEVAPDGTAPADDPQTPKNLPGLPTSRPAKSATKREWVGWAVANGMPLDDADALNKDQLIDQFGLITVAP